MAIGYKLTPWKVKFFLIYSATESQNHGKTGL